MKPKDEVGDDWNWKVGYDRWAKEDWNSSDHSWRVDEGFRNMQLAAADERGLWLRLQQYDMVTEQDSTTACIGQIPAKAHIDITSHLRHLWWPTSSFQTAAKHKTKAQASNSQHLQAMLKTPWPDFTWNMERISIATHLQFIIGFNIDAETHELQLPVISTSDTSGLPLLGP